MGEYTAQRISNKHGKNAYALSTDKTTDYKVGRGPGMFSKDVQMGE